MLSRRVRITLFAIAMAAVSFCLFSVVVFVVSKSDWYRIREIPFDEAWREVCYTTGQEVTVSAEDTKAVRKDAGIEDMIFIRMRVPAGDIDKMAAAWGIPSFTHPEDVQYYRDLVTRDMSNYAEVTPWFARWEKASPTVFGLKTGGRYGVWIIGCDDGPGETVVFVRCDVSKTSGLPAGFSTGIVRVAKPTANSS